MANGLYKAGHSVHSKNRTHRPTICLLWKVNPKTLMLGDFHKSHLVVVSFCLFLPQCSVMQGDRVFTGQGSHVTGMVPSFVIHLIWFFTHHPFPNLSLMLVRFYELSPVILLSLYEMLYRRHTRKVPQFVMYCCTWIYFYDKYVLLYILYRVQKTSQKPPTTTRC